MENTTEVEHCHDPGREFLMTDTDSFLYCIYVSSGCVENPIIYVDEESNNEVPHEQIVSLIELSEYCEQSFQYDCTLGKYIFV